jgi:hypothetical protein
MQEGMYLGAPPVDIGRSVANATLRCLLRGSSFITMGPPVPLATPQIQTGLLRSPAAANRNADLTALYPLNPAAFKQQLRQQFGG